MGKRVLYLSLIFLMLISSFSVNAAPETGEDFSAEYSFGEYEGEAKPGEIIKVPLLLSVPETPITSVLVKISYDEAKLEYIPYKSNQDKGDKKFTLTVMDLMQNDSSVISGVFAGTADLLEFDENILCYLRFTVKEDAVPGDTKLRVIYSELEYAPTVPAIISKRFASTEGVITIYGADSPLAGDCDGDGKVTVMDAVAVMRHVADIEQISPSCLVSADVDKIDGITIGDATTILKYIARLINEL